jgi:putative phosphoesterase
MASKPSEVIIGVVSDTHSLLRAEALDALRGSDYIIHAGDVGDSSIIPALQQIAPVTAVRGNIDVEPWARDLPEDAVLQVGDMKIYIIHNLKELRFDPAAVGYGAVISGHSHVPKQETIKGLLYFNPGSAGPRRFHLPITVGRLRINEGAIFPELISLEK